MKYSEIGVTYIDEPDLLRAYLSDASPLRGERPYVAFFPKDSNEVSKVLKWANEEEVAVYPFAGGTSLVGSPLPNGGVILDLILLNDLEVFPKDKLALVGSAWKPSELNSVLSKHGLWFPIDPGSYDIATIGGMIATNAGGIRAVKYGVTADRVRAIEFVTPIGEVIWSGAWSKKSSTWIRVHQLLIGSEGQFGVVTKALLELENIPNKREVLLIGTSIEEVGQLVLELLDFGPSALEFMDETTVKAVNEHPSAPFRLREEAVLLVEFDDPEAGEKASALSKEYSALRGDAEKTWKFRKLAGQALTYKYGKRADWDVAVPLSQLSPALKFVNERLSEGAVFGHFGDGNLHVNYLGKSIEEVLEDAKELICEMVKRFRATVSGEHGIGLLKLPMLHCEVSEETIELWRRLKIALDPKLILNPGKKIPF